MLPLKNGDAYNPGDTLLCNGATLLQAKRYSAHLSDRHLYVVLCKYDDEYVTWIYRNDEMFCFWGHYYRDKQEAIEDYHTRTYKHD